MTPPIVETLNRWANNWGCGKAFVHKYRPWSSKPKLAKMMLLSPHAERWVEFLEAEPMAVHASLKLVRLQVLFVRDEPEGVWHLGAAGSSRCWASG